MNRTTEVRSPVIDGLRPRDRARLLQRSVPRRLARGERLYLAGDTARRAHLVLSGVIKLVASDACGRESILGLATAGDVLGDVAALDRRPQPLDAVAASPTVALGFDADVFVAALSASPRAALELARLLAGRTRWMGSAAMERATAEVPARLAGRLLDLAEVAGRSNAGALDIDLPLAQADLARLAGMCRESACRTLRSFKDAGFVDYRRGRMRILRPDALRLIRCGGRLP